MACNENTPMRGTIMENDNFDRIPAKELSVGTYFMLFDTKCFIVYAEPNRYDQMVIRFVTNTDVDSLISHLVVAPNFEFVIPHLI